MIGRRAQRTAVALCLVVAGRGAGGARALAAETTAADATPDGALPRITVVRPVGGDADLVEIATRAWAELTASGVAATLLDCPAAADSCQTKPPPPGVSAITLATFRRSGETITEVTLRVAGHDRPIMRRSLVVSDEAAADPKVTAIRAVELVDAMLIEADSTSTLPPAALPRPAVAADDELPGYHLKRKIDLTDLGNAPLPEQGVNPRPAFVPAGWSMGVGAAFLKGFGGLSGALGLLARGSYVGGRGLGLNALVAVAASDAATPTLDGDLTLLQELAALEVTYRFIQRARLSPYVALGGGGYHARASWGGGPEMSFVRTRPGTASAVWALLLSGGAGAGLALGPELSLFVDARAVLAAPSPQAFDNQGHALKTADPSLLLSLGVQRGF